MKFFLSTIKQYDFNPLHVSWWKQTTVAIIYFLTALLSISFTTHPNTGSTPIWIPGGIAVGLLFIWGYSLWLGVFLGILMAEFTIYQGWNNFSTLVLILCLTIITTLGKIIASICSESQNQHNPEGLNSRYFLYNAKNTAKFIVFGSFVSHIPIGIICASLVCVFGNASWNLFPAIAITWWLSDSFGILIFTPLIIAWEKQINTFTKLIKKQWLEVIIIVFLTLIFNQTIYTDYHLEYLFIPLLVWTVFRFHELGASLIVLMITIILVIETVQGNTSFVRESSRDSLLLLQSFVACISMTNLILSAVLNENSYAKKELIKFNQLLLNKNSQLKELNYQKELQTQAKEKLLIDYNQILEKQLSLIKAKEEAENLTQQKSHFLASLSDQFRNPMNGVLGMAEMLANTELTAEQKKYIETIRKTGADLLKSVNDILDFSTIEIGDLVLEKEKIKIEEIIKSVFILFVKKAEEKQLNFTFSIPHNLPLFIGDSARIRQILFNILDNAFKFTDKGSISILVKEADFLQEDDDSKVEKKCLMFIIKDTGQGIKGEYISHIFEPFSQEHYHVSRQLGLVIAKSLINAMDGAIWIESKGNIAGNHPSKWYYSSTSFQGSTVYFTLHLPPLLTTSKHKNHCSDHNISSSNLAILVAEDNRINQKVFNFYLKKLEINPDIVHDGIEVIKKLERQDYDIIFIDISMPKMDGVLTVEKIRKIYNNNHYIIAVHPHITDKKDYYLSLGFNDCINKPLNFQEIKSIIMNIKFK